MSAKHARIFHKQEEMFKNKIRCLKQKIERLEAQNSNQQETIRQLETDKYKSKSQYIKNQLR